MKPGNEQGHGRKLMETLGLEKVPKSSGMVTKLDTQTSSSPHLCSNPRFKK